MSNSKGCQHGSNLTPIRSVVRSVGMSVPPRVVTNDYFSSYLDTSDQWIRERTGISERRWVAPGVSTSDLAMPACIEALDRAGLEASDVDGIIVATVTPDYAFPSTACFLQKKLGSRGFAFDINAVCSGFIFAMVLADSLLKTGQAKRILVVGSDIYSNILDHKDRSTCVLFGDGAGAMLLEAIPCVGEISEQRGIIDSQIISDGSHTDILCVPIGSAKIPTPESLLRGEHFLTMEGKEVFRLAVRGLADISKTLLKRAQVPVEELDYLVSHQANKRILNAVAKSLSLPDEKVPSNVEKYGNTSAASIPILLSELDKSGQLQEGMLVMLSAFGGGVTWGAVLLRW